MDFAEADVLAGRISDFLESCGGAYTNGVNREVQANILHALATGQYVLKEDSNGIIYFVSFWRVHSSDVQDVVKRVKPADLTHGTVVYISELGNKAGRSGMARMIQEIRDIAGDAKGVFWHRPVKQDKIYHFPHQKGADHGK